MNLVTILLALLLAAAVAAALSATVRKLKKGGGCCGTHEAAVRKQAVSDRNKSHYPYHISVEIGGMTCENCARRVQNALNAVPDVLAEVRIDTKQAEVRCKSELDEEKMRELREAVRQAGYAMLKTL